MTGEQRWWRRAPGEARPPRPVAPPPGEVRRHHWLDAGRGLAIVLVVLLHASDWLSAGGLDEGAWSVANDVLAGLRMPLFFTISGLLGAGWPARSWPEILSSKVTFLVWVYLAWQPIGLLAAALADRFTGHHQTVLHFFVALAATVLRPRSELWFLWALALYFVVARLSVRVPWPAQFGVAAAVSAVSLSALFPATTLGWDGVPKFYLFFLLGVHLRAALLRFAEHVDRARSLSWGLVATWAALAVVAVTTGLDLVVGVGLLVRLLGLAAGVALAVRWAGCRPLRYLGSHTLPIYLAHTPVVILLTWSLQPARRSGLPRDVVLGLPLALTVIAVGTSLLLHRTAGMPWARNLYAPPVGVQQAVRRVSARAG